MSSFVEVETSGQHLSYVVERDLYVVERDLYVVECDDSNWNRSSLGS